MLIDEVNKHLDSKRDFIRWISRRTIAQVEALDAFLPTIGAKVNATVALEADDNILVARLLERGKTSGRIDDQDEEKIRNRYQEYNEKTAPLIGYCGYVAVLVSDAAFIFNSVWIKNNQRVTSSSFRMCVLFPVFERSIHLPEPILKDSLCLSLLLFRFHRYYSNCFGSSLRLFFLEQINSD